MTHKRKTIPGLQRALALAMLAGFAANASGCIEDADCGVCDPDNLVLESISGINYAKDKIQLLSPTCEGPNCPAPFDRGTYFIEEVIPCEETEDALASPSPSEYCKLAPLVTAFGIEFIFNNLLEPTSIELVRKRPDNPQLFEVYDWKSDIVHLEGPITRFNGDYNRGGSDQPDTISRMVNLTCAEQVQGFGADSYADPANNPCNQLIVQDGQIKPLKMKDGEVWSYRGEWTAFGNSCSSPQDGPDTCCTRCDWLLSTRVARYGLDRPARAGETAEEWRANERNPNIGTAIECAPADSTDIIDVFDVCKPFNIGVDRSEEEQTWTYAFGGEPQPHKLPLYDKLRETHPDLRPDGLENFTAKCSSTNDCAEIHGLSGSQCVGIREDWNPENWDPTDENSPKHCLMDATAYAESGCVEGVCRPQWFVGCGGDADTTGGVRYCQDRRFAKTGTAACFTGEEPFEALRDDEGVEVGVAEGGTSLAYCDGNENNLITAAECCQETVTVTRKNGQKETVESLGGPNGACDPFYQANVEKIGRYKRDENLPEQTRSCVCTDLDRLEAEDPEQFALCRQVIQAGCYDGEGNFIAEEGEYAVKTVARRGGVVYDPALKGFDWRPADIGGIPRADIESCAENNIDRLISGRNRHDGWRANDAFAPETYEDFDRGMCSGQEYTVVFAEPGADAYVRDKVGNTLQGKSVYKFETSQFHVEPGSGFPTDNLRIGACDSFQLRFSNKYDMSPENLQKLQIFRLDDDGNLLTPNDRCDVVGPVAGGAGCVETEAELEAADDPCLAPCLTVDISGQAVGNVEVEIDPTEFGPVLDRGETYTLLAPTAGSVDEVMGNPDIYQQVFWDVCGMPLVAEDAIPYSYVFSIDRPKCKEDQDFDDVQESCDNAKDHFNPDQGDMDRDGFGDVIDLCPTIASSNNTADSDKDGVGNDCDNCRQTLNQYNADAAALALPAYMLVRNIPFQDDADQDGIGDVCDNCVLAANCDEYGSNNPWELEDPIPYDNDNLCQRDDNADMVGDACEGDMVNDFAAGPVGLGPLEDFDQDGVRNESDACPRQPMDDTITCMSNDDCPEFRTCALYSGMDTGVCNHLDSDQDGVGDICDTCPFDSNPMQVVDGEMQADDEDGDFVGAVCETSPQCADTEKDPRRFGFYPVQANGQCCTVELVQVQNAPEELLELLPKDFMGGPEDLINAFTATPLLDPDGLPIRETCTPEQTEAGECRALPVRVAMAPGILEPPPGCPDALTDAGITVFENVQQRLNDLDFGGDFDALWQTQCFLPQWDQDYDGLGDACDLCDFDFDPENLPYIDANGRVWPGNGKYCFGDYSIDNKCDLTEPGDTDGDTDGGTGDMGTTGGGTGGDSATSG